MKYNKGFTLIELLVVIAIIGILSSVVLVSLNSARNKGRDVRVITAIQQLRTKIEADYVSNYNASFTAADTLSTSGDYGVLVTDITNNGGQFTVKTNGTAPFTQYALYGRLVNDPSKYFCIDSTGKTNQAATASSTVTCPN